MAHGHMGASPCATMEGIQRLPHQPMLTVQLFGPPQLQLDERPVPIARRKSRALLYYLAAQPSPVTRDHLLQSFWPDHERAAAQHMLRTNLHSLRAALGPALQAHAETLRLAPEVAVDVRRFATGLGTPPGDPAHLSTLLELYRGDFLEGFTLTDVPTFDDWAAAERERYRRLFIRGLSALSSLQERQQQLGLALATLERALAVEPLQEDLQRAAIRLSYLGGDRAGAIRRYEQLRRLLDAELGVPPMDETRALYDAIISDTLPREQISAPALVEPLTPPAAPPAAARAPTAPQRRAAPLPFTGRARELAALHALTAEPRLVVVEGEPGIGKTRLLEEFAGTTGSRVLWGAAHELERALPYHPLIEALRDLTRAPDWAGLRNRLNLAPVWLAEVARLLPELLESSAPLNTPPADESRLWEGLHQFLTALSQHQPLVLVLDDLHWADDSTLALLGYLVRRSAALGIPIGYLVATRRVTPQSPLQRLLQSLTRADLVEQIALARFDPEVVRELTFQLSPTAGALTDWLAAASEGNPFMLAELLRAAHSQGLLEGSRRLPAQVLAEPMVPRTVYALIQSRLGRLSEAARRVLDVAVAVGRDFGFDLVVHTAALSETAALDAIDELLAAELIVPGHQGQYTFDHSLTMEVAAREMGELRYRRLHRRVAEALEGLYRQQLDEVAGLLVRHFTEGGLTQRAAAYALRAGRRAARLAAWREAIAFYEQALANDNAAERCDILMALGHAHYAIGDLAQATAAYAGAADLAEARGEHELADDARLFQGRALLPQARYPEAAALARAIAAGKRQASRARAELLWGSALALEGLELAEAAEHLAHAQKLLAQAPTPDPDSQVLASFSLGVVAAQQGNLERAVDCYRTVLFSTEELRFDTADQWAVLAQNNLAYHLHLLGDLSAREHAEAGLRLAHERGILGFQTYLHSTLGEIALAEGDLTAAERHFVAGLRLAEEHRLPERVAGLTANLGRLAARRGDRTGAVRNLVRARELAERIAAHHLAAQTRLWVAPLLPPGEARAELAAVRALALQTGRQRLLDEVGQLEARLSDV